MDNGASNTTQPTVNDDQELAKALASVTPIMPEPQAAPASSMPTPTAPPAVTPEPADTDLKFEETPVSPVKPAPAPASTPSPSGDLDGIKKDALNELRPLIGKVDLPAEEKFDTYLMLIRSTDDSSLIGPAHDAALAISDEKRRAEALLDVIKEIDYLSAPHDDKTSA